MKIAIFANDDMTSNLIFAPLFELPDVEIVSVYFAAGPRKGARSLLGGTLSLMSRMSFRYWFFLVLSNGLFKVFEGITLGLRLSPRAGPFVSLRRLARERNIDYRRIVDFSSPNIVADVKSQGVDLLLIRIGSILKADILMTPRVGTWCVHSSLLPSFKGIAGEFHALRTPGAPIGSTVFEVTPVLDSGPPLSQVAIPRADDRSVLHHMLANNIAAGDLLKQMVAARASNPPAPGILLNDGLTESYYGWPSRENVDVFRRQGKRLIDLAEVIKMAAVALRIRHTI